MVQDHGAAGEDQAGIRGGCVDAAAAGLALEFIAEVAEPAEGELARVTLRGAQGAAAPDAVEPTEKSALGPNGGVAHAHPGPAGTVPDRLAVAAAVVGQDAEAAALGSRAAGCRALRGAALPGGALRQGGIQPDRVRGAAVKLLEEPGGVRRGVEPLGRQLQPATGRKLREQHRGQGGKVLEGLQHLCRGGAVGEVEQPHVGPGGHIVGGEPLVFLPGPLLPVRFVALAVAGHGPAAAVPVGGVGPDHGVKEGGGGRGGRAHALDQDDFGRLRQPGGAVIVPFPVPADPAGRFAAAQRGKHRGGIAFDARGQAVPAGVDVLEVEEGDLVVFAEPRREFDGEGGLACAGASVDGDDDGCGAHELERTRCPAVSRCGWWGWCPTRPGGRAGVLWLWNAGHAAHRLGP